MNYSKSITLYFIFISFYAVFLIIFFKKLDIDVENSWYALSLIFLPIVILFLLDIRKETKYKINPKYVSKFKLIWKDNLDQGYIKSQLERRFFKRLKILIILYIITMVLLIFVISPKSWQRIDTDTLFIFSSFTLIFIVYFSILRRSYNTSNIMNNELKVYKEGIYYNKDSNNVFLKWLNIKNIRYSFGFNMEKILPLGDIKYSTLKVTDTLRIIDNNEYVHFIEVFNRKGFEESLKKLKKYYLLK